MSHIEYYIFHVELAPLGGIFGPLKSDLGVFLPFRGTDFIMGKNQNANFSKKGSLPDFKIFGGDSCGNLTKNGTNLSTGDFFFGFHPYKSLCSIACMTIVLWALGKAR